MSAPGHLRTDPSFARGVGTIIDIRDSESERTHEEIRQIAKLLGEQRGKTGDRLAVVVSDALHYGLGRMFAAYAEFRDLSVEVFTNLEDANRWLEAKTASRPHPDTSPIFSRVPAPQFSKGASQRKESND